MKFRHPLLLLFFLGGSAAAIVPRAVDLMAPLDIERPWGQEKWHDQVERERVADAPVPAEFPEVKVSRGDGTVRADYPQLEERNYWPEIEVLRASADGRVVLPNGGGVISLAGIATAHHTGKGKQDMVPKWRGPIDGEAIAAEQVEAWDIDKKHEKLWGHFPDRGSQLKIILSAEGVANPLWMSADVFDAGTLGRLNWSGRSPRQRSLPAVYDFTGPFWHGGPLKILVEFAWGEFAEAEGPAKPGTVLQVPGAMAGLFALQNGRQRGAGYGYDQPSFVESRFIEPDPEKAGLIALCGVLPWPRGQIIDLELIGKDGAVSVTTGRGMDYVCNRLFSEINAEDAVTFRMKKRPNWSRAIFEVPGLPDAPNDRDKIKDGFDLKIPFAKFRRLTDMTTFISRSAQIPPLVFSDFDKLPGLEKVEFPRSYHDVTVREMLAELTEAANVDLRLNPETFRAVITPRKKER